MKSPEFRPRKNRINVDPNLPLVRLTLTWLDAGDLPAYLQRNGNPPLEELIAADPEEARIAVAGFWNWSISRLRNMRLFTDSDHPRTIVDEELDGREAAIGALTNLVDTYILAEGAAAPPLEIFRYAPLAEVRRLVGLDYVEQLGMIPERSAPLELPPEFDDGI
ncbi:MAG TPA: hypothetical protein VJP80_05370 [Candidatus Saccharimonadales bacterium]|nr:hypothetical protein [Candidatus Saccharimonadales bacterium]